MMPCKCTIVFCVHAEAFWLWAGLVTMSSSCSHALQGCTKVQAVLWVQEHWWRIVCYNAACCTQLEQSIWLVMSSLMLYMSFLSTKQTWPPLYADCTHNFSHYDSMPRKVTKHHIMLRVRNVTTACNPVNVCSCMRLRLWLSKLTL